MIHPDEVFPYYTIPLTVTVEDTDGTAKDGLPVYAFDGTTYTGYNGTTDVNGEVMLTLPQGDYRFRSDLNGTHFWSDEINHCTIPGCELATVVVTLPVTVTVTNTDAVPQGGLPVYVFDEATYTGFNGTTDVNGEVALTLPQGDYRFRSDLNGTQFWSGETNHCTIPGCLNASITVTIPMIVTVQSQTGSPYPDLPVYVFASENYTGFNGTSDENGQVVFTLPVGDYRFRSDYDGVQFWSGEGNHCTIPSCLEATVEIPGGVGEVSVTIDYTYDPLFRLTAADYDTSEFFHYTYDAVGNRMTQETHEETNAYVYDVTNRLIEVDGVAYVWDNNGNLIQDDTRIYGYDYANRLTFVLMDGDTYNFSYNGLGDRLRQTVNGIPTIYWLDINRALTQVLGDGENAFLYGEGRIGEEQSGGWQYHIGDALGSVRQLLDSAEAVTFAQNYTPYGSTLDSVGSVSTVFQFTGEQVDATELSYLRVRYYDSSTGRFLIRDTWVGNDVLPLSINRWAYAHANPINYSDPTVHVISPTGPQMCLSFFSFGLMPDPTISAEELVDFCKSFYSQSFWKDNSAAGLGNYDCASMNVQPWEKPETVTALFGFFICELGRNHIRFSGSDTLTRKLAHSFALDRVRRDFYSNGPIYPREERFGLAEYLEEWVRREEPGFPIMQVIGSFDISAQRTSRGRVKIWVHNRMDLASGTHFIGRFPPEGQSRYPLSLEEVLGKEQTLRNQLAWRVIASYKDDYRGKIVSVLMPRTRLETSPGMGGGNFEQTFTWTERDMTCEIEDKPWPGYLQLLDIGLGR